MKKEEKIQKEKELDLLFDSAVSEGGSDKLDENMLMDVETLSEGVQLHDTDYDKEMEEVLDESSDIIKDMAGLYINNTMLLNNPYILSKIKNDAQNLADMKFLQNLAKKAIIKQMQSLEDADMATPRHFETLYSGLKEIRDNIKQSTATTSVMEDFYLKLKKDLDIPEDKKEEVEEENKNISSFKDMNKQLQELIEKKKKK